MKTQDIKNIASAYKQVLEKKLDAVNPDELKGTHAQRKDKDIDNDGDVDSSDEYLHNRRKAIKTAMKKEEVEQLDELSPQFKAKYVQKARKSVDQMKAASDHHLDKGFNTTGREADRNFRQADKLHALAKKRSKIINKVANEEVDLNEELSDEKFNKVVSTKGVVASHDRKGGVHFSKGGKSLGFKMHPRGRSGADHVHTWLQNMGFKKQGTNNLGVAYHKEDTDMTESRWPILQRIMERQNHGNMNNGSPRGEGLSPSAKAELARSEGDSGIDGAKAAADTIQNAAAGVKVAPKRRGDQTIGDKNHAKE